MTAIIARAASRSMRLRDATGEPSRFIRTAMGLIRDATRWASPVAVAAAGALLLMGSSGGALAGCSTANAWVCTTTGSQSGSNPQGPLVPTTTFTVSIGQSGTPDKYTMTNQFNSSHEAAVVIDNTNNYSGTITETASSVLVGSSGDGLRFYDLGNTGTNTITFNINGTLYGGNDTTFVTHPGDGLHIGQSSTHAPTVSSDSVIGTLNINVGNVNNTSAVIRGADDGVYIAQNIAVQATITNYGTINGKGVGTSTGDPNGENWGEGVHVSSVDGGVGDGYQVTGAVTVDNHGTIAGHANIGTDDDNGPGSAINISADGAIIVDNYSGATANGADGLVAYGNGTSAITVDNEGHIGGSVGDGANLSHAASITVDNHSLGSMIGATNGQEISYSNTASYDNSGGLTAGLSGSGLTGNGLIIDNISGATSSLPQYAVTITNTIQPEGSEGGIIVGAGSGINMFGIVTSYTAGKNGILIDNSGSGTSSDVDKAPGGLIVGEYGNGIEIGGAQADVLIDNSNTANGAGNDLSASTIDPLVGYDGKSTDTTPAGPTLLDKLVHGTGPGFTYDLNYVLSGDYAPTAPADGITTGIWGQESGIYAQNIQGTTTINNGDGQIFGKTTDGIQLYQIGASVSGDIANPVVSIDNRDGGLVEGAQNGAEIEDVKNGSVDYKNQGGTTLGGNNGIYVDVYSGDSNPNSVDGSVTIENEGGLIAGQSDDGIDLNSVGDNVTIYNNTDVDHLTGGTIAGGDTGIAVDGVGGVFGLNNSSGFTYGDGGDGVNVSNVTGTGADADTAAVAIANNQGGVIAGADGNGVTIDTVAAETRITGDAVWIDNTRGDGGTAAGVIVGSDYGISVSNVGAAYHAGENVVSIDNSGYRDNTPTTKPGGLIVGVDNSAISMGSVYADITIDNSNTRDNGANDLSGIDPAVADMLSGLSDASGDDFLPADSPTTGIWGLGGDGIDIEDTGGTVTITNQRGQIGGLADEGGTGIVLSDVTGPGSGTVIDIDNSNGSGTSEGGLITGGDFGIVMSSVSGGNITINNDYGTIYGDEMAIALGGNGQTTDLGLTGGSVTIYNANGLIEGVAGSNASFGSGIPGSDSLGAITINDVQAAAGVGGNVTIYNSDEVGANGGSIIGVKSASAISIGSFETGGEIGTSEASAVGTADIYNGTASGRDGDGPVTGGIIIGSGSTNEPVIRLNTSGNTNITEEAFNGYVDNLGVIASTNLYGFVDPDSGDGQTNLRTVYSDASTVLSYVESGGQNDVPTVALGQLNDSTNAVSDNVSAAADNAIVSTVGSVLVQNESGALLFGTVNLTGSNENSDSAQSGDELDNNGMWFTLGTNTVGGDYNGTIHNDGLIQTAFGSVDGTTTTFNVSAFYNDSPAAVGYLSSLDGTVGDKTVISGDFIGKTTDDNSQSYVAIDAYLDVASGTPGADTLEIGGKVTGTTALIINNLNPDSLLAGNSTGIEVVQVDNPDGGNGCASVACMEGDAFYISNASTDYIDINGHGAIQQGMFAWYLTEQPTGTDAQDGYYLVTAALPTADQTPELMTAFFNIFYADTDLVSDHLHGGHFPDVGSGGSGDDVTPQGPGTNTTNSAVWARASASWSTGNSSVDDGLGAFDTSYKQNIYTLLGGLDMSPDAADGGLRFGAFGGYIQSGLSFNSYGASGKFTGGEVGGYVAYTHGGFYADSQFDADFADVHFNAPLGGGTSLDTTGTTMGIVANVGDRMYRGRNFFEPLASFAYANMTLGDQEVDGSRVDFSNGESLRGGVGARIGTTFKGKDGTVAEFSLLGRVWNEFSGNNTVTITDGVNLPDTFTNDTSGLYGEVEGSVSFAATESGTSTYISAGGLFGSNSTTLNARAGVRQQF